MRLPKADRTSIDDLNRLQIPNTAGPSRAAQLARPFDYQRRLRHDQPRQPETRRDAHRRHRRTAQHRRARRRAEERLQVRALPAGYEIRYAGEKETQDESTAFLWKAFVIALLIILDPGDSVQLAAGAVRHHDDGDSLADRGAVGLLVWQSAVRHHHDGHRRHQPGRRRGEQRHRAPGLHAEVAGTRDGPGRGGGRGRRHASAARAADGRHDGHRPDPDGRRRLLRLPYLLLGHQERIHPVVGKHGRRGHVRPDLRHDPDAGGRPVAVRDAHAGVSAAAGDLRHRSRRQQRVGSSPGNASLADGEFKA